MQLALIIPVDGSNIPHPGYPLPPPMPGQPDQGLPGGGGAPHPWPPGGGDPPHASHPIALPPGMGFPPGVTPPIVPPDPPPGSVWPPLPPDAPPGKFVIAVFIPGYGVKWVVVNLAQPK
jgi:hypothetical protein